MSLPVKPVGGYVINEAYTVGGIDMIFTANGFRRLPSAGNYTPVDDQFLTGYDSETGLFSGTGINETDPIFVDWRDTARAANTVYSGPVSGANAIATFRSLVVADIPDLSGTYLTSETDPTVPAHVKAITTNNIAGWNTAYSLSHTRLHSVTSGTDHQMTGESMIGRTVGGLGVPSALTATQVRAFLNVADGANQYAHPNHSGDVTSVGDGATTIASKAVTFAKFQDIAASSLLGNPTGSAGAMQAISLGDGLSFDGTSLKASFDAIWAEDTDIYGTYAEYENRVFMGGTYPTGWERTSLYINTGTTSATWTAFRVEDGNRDLLFSIGNTGAFLLPNIPERTAFESVMVVTTSTGEVGYRDIADIIGEAGASLAGLNDTNFTNLQDGHGLYYNSATSKWVNLAPPEGEGTGTVTSVGLSVPVGSGLAVSGSPVTTSGTLALSFTSGYSIPTDTKQSQWDGAVTLSHDQKHTMASTLDHMATAHRVFYSDGGGNVQELGFGADGQFLKSNGPSAAPSWAVATGGEGVSNFLELEDTPASYAGNANKAVAVNASSNGLTFVDFPGGTNNYVTGMDFTPANRTLTLTREGLDDIEQMIDMMRSWTFNMQGATTQSLGMFNQSNIYLIAGDNITFDYAAPATWTIGVALTKAAIEEVLTGPITTHSHSIPITTPTGVKSGSPETETFTLSMEEDHVYKVVVTSDSAVGEDTVIILEDLQPTNAHTILIDLILDVAAQETQSEIADVSLKVGATVVPIKCWHLDIPVGFVAGGERIVISITNFGSNIGDLRISYINMTE